MSSDQQSKHQPMVQGTLALKEVTTNTPTNMPVKGLRLVQSVPPTKPEVSIPNALEMTPARQFFINLRIASQAAAAAATPPAAAKQPENLYETNCGQCGLVMIFRNPLTDWVKAFCGRCGESVWVR
jgi:ribosomal protein S27AE